MPSSRYLVDSDAQQIFGYRLDGHRQLAAAA
jgi:hypothetical protein